MNTYSKVIFVCVGNTIRGPMAETIMTKELSETDILVESRGIVVLFPEPYNPKVIAIAAKYGYIMANNNAKQLEKSDFSKDTLVLVMDATMKRKLYKEYDEAINVYTMGEFIGRPDDEIEDPYGRDMDTYDVCFRHMQGILKRAANIIIKNCKNQEEE